MDFISRVMNVYNVMKVVSRVKIYLLNVRVVVVPILNINTFRKINVYLVVLAIIIIKDSIAFNVMSTALLVTVMEAKIVLVVNRDYFILRLRKPVAPVVLRGIFRMVVIVYHAIRHVRHAMVHLKIIAKHAMLIEIFIHKTKLVLYAHLGILIKVLYVNNAIYRVKHVREYIIIVLHVLLQILVCYGTKISDLAVVAVCRVIIKMN